MVWQTSFLAATLALQSAIASPVDFEQASTEPESTQASAANFRIRETKAFAEATPLKITDRILALKSTGSKSKSSIALHNALRNSVHDAPLTIPWGGDYAIDIDFGGETFQVVLDTGSSDLWLARTDVHCVDTDMNHVATAECGFADEIFDVTYGGGEFLTGVLGYERVGVAGVGVDRQELGLVDHAYWMGDNVTSGLIGFAYPSMTSAYHGTDPSAETAAVLYTPWIFNAIEKGLIEPMFSLAIERGEDGEKGGQLALGGLPNVTFNHTFTSTPFQITELPRSDAAAKNYSYYAITPTGYLLSSNDESYRSYQPAPEAPRTYYSAIVDSGSTPMLLPDRIASDVNAHFDPPSVFNDDEVYENYCDATPPSFAISINSTDFFISREDLLVQKVQSVQDGSPRRCLAGAQALLAEGPCVLGDVFLKNVVAVFDIGASEMRFAPRVTY
ncbi:hypothetical protein LTR08_002655 [Meristemomyces frigidus]|nr:hypothetical protein LTR08_002655 [Meristemomyces frigidus]